MEPYNPSLKYRSPGKKIITLGEVMLRLTPPNYEKIRMSSTFEVSFGHGKKQEIAVPCALCSFRESEQLKSIPLV